MLIAASHFVWTASLHTIVHINSANNTKEIIQSLQVTEAEPLRHWNRKTTPVVHSMDVILPTRTDNTINLQMQEEV